MQLKHLNLCVSDVPAAQAFFERYFAFRCIQAQEVSGHIVLMDKDAFALVLSPAEPAAPTVYPGRFHIGFVADNADVVRAMHERMRTEGVELVTEPTAFGFGTAFYGHAPGGVAFEVSSRVQSATGDTRPKMEG